MTADVAPAAPVAQARSAQGGRAIGWLLVALGVLSALAAATAIVAQATSGAQPWTDELSDNFIFAKSIAFTLGLGVAVGAFRGRVGAKAAIAPRRFSVGTAVGHWTIVLGFLLALPTGAWQYLGGILDVTAPLPLYWFYRVHYIGATLILFSVASFVTYWWLSGDRSLVVPRAEWRGHLRGLVDELPRAIGARLVKLLKVDMKSQPPDPGDFDFYEKVVSFPLWTFAVGLITITGLIKASRYVFPVPGPALYWASTLHVAAMVLIGIALLDHLRYNLGHWPDVVAMVTTRMGGGRRGLRVLFAAIGVLWALASLLVAYLFITNAFVAKTAAKEGLPAQLALLVGGAVIAIFAIALARLCAGMIRRDLGAQ